MQETDLDVNLANGKTLDDWLSGWLQSAARDPASVKAVVTDEDSRGVVIELQDSTGIARGGIVFTGHRGNVHILGALDPQDREKTRKRSIDEMLAALEHAVNRTRRQDGMVHRYEFFLFGIVPIAALAMVGWLVRHLMK